jgi:hypothetical protein
MLPLDVGRPARDLIASGAFFHALGGGSRLAASHRSPQARDLAPIENCPPIGPLTGRA